MRHNLHTMKYRDFMCTILPILMNAYPCIAPSLSAPGIFLLPPKSFLMLFQSVLILPHLQVTRVWFLSHKLNLTTLGFHTNRIMQHVLFCVWLLSLFAMFLSFTHVVFCIAHCLLLSTIPLCTTAFLFIILLMDIWIMSSLWLLWIKLIWNSCARLFLDIHFCFSHINI